MPVMNYVLLIRQKTRVNNSETVQLVPICRFAFSLFPSAVRLPPFAFSMNTFTVIFRMSASI